jgi:hypothetical protein
MFARLQLGLLSLLGMALIIVSRPRVQCSRRKLKPLAELHRVALAASPETADTNKNKGTEAIAPVPSTLNLSPQ